MHLPEVVRWTLAAAMVVVTAYHVGRLTARRRPADVDVLHAAMGAVMTAMLVGDVGVTASAALAGAFAAAGMWFGRRAVLEFVLHAGGAAPARQLVGCAAMAYVLAATATAPSMGAMSMNRSVSPLIAGAAVLAVLTVAAAVRPRMAVATGCQLAMSATTVLMLVTL